MHVAVRCPQDLTPAEVGAWRRLQAADSNLDNAFLAPEFSVAVGRYRSDVRVAVIREADEIVALLPFERGRFGIGRALAQGISDAQAVICAPDLDVHPVELIRACGLGVWEYDHLVSHLDQFAPNTYCVASSRVMDLREGYEAFMREDNREGRRTVRSLLQKRRNMERDLGPLDFVFESSDSGALDTLMRWKSAQYERTGKFDRFSRGWIRNVVSDLACCDAPGCRGTLSTLSAGGRLAAVDLAIRTSTRLSAWFVAYDAELGKYSPGLQLFFAMAQAAAEHGIGILDLGKGDEVYKESLSSWDYPLASGRVVAASSARMVQGARRSARRVVVNAVATRPRLRALLPRSLAGADRVR
jgi:CelD/BcsL family acetyltransferase involved in cellulose biosynthesis